MAKSFVLAFMVTLMFYIKYYNSHSITDGKMDVRNMMKGEVKTKDERINKKDCEIVTHKSKAHTLVIKNCGKQFINKHNAGKSYILGTTRRLFLMTWSLAVIIFLELSILV